jgi:hypothetical protein
MLMKKQRFILVILLTLTFLFILTSCGDSGVLLYINNKTDQTLSIYITGVYQNDVPPGVETRTGTMQIPPEPDLQPVRDKYLIEAKTKAGELVYSKEFTWNELNDLDWKVVIPSQ